MSRELPSGRLGDFVDKRRVNAVSQSEGAAAVEAVRKEWKDDNLAAHGLVRTAVAGLGFPDIVEGKREVLRELPGYMDGSIEVRTVNWIPDSSEATIAAPEPRIRAVQGHVVLVSGRKEGVNGNFLEIGEHADGAFYVLGMAVEDGASLSLHKVVAPGLDGSHKHLYDLLTGGWYEFEVAEHNDRLHRGFFGNLDLNVEYLGNRGLEIPAEVQERSDQKRAAMDKARQDAEEDFAKTMAKLSEKIIEGPIDSTSREVQELLLGVQATPAPQKKGIRRLLSAGRTESPAEPKPTYAQYKEPLFEWNQPSDTAALDESFDIFLATNPVITRIR